MDHLWWWTKCHIKPCSTCTTCNAQFACFLELRNDTVAPQETCQDQTEQHASWSLFRAFANKARALRLALLSPISKGERIATSLTSAQKCAISWPAYFTSPNACRALERSVLFSYRIWRRCLWWNHRDWWGDFLLFQRGRNYSSGDSEPHCQYIRSCVSKIFLTYKHHNS